MKSIVIFGGAGFIGKHLIRRLAKCGFKIIVPYQKSTGEEKIRLLGNTGQIIPFYFSDLKDRRIINILKHTSVCINLKTSWSSKKISFNQAIFEFNKDLTNILKKNESLEQVIFFSGLGIDEDKKSLRSVAINKSENLISSNFKNSIIIRPGIILGGDDKFLSLLIPIFKMSYFIPLFGNGSSKFQPVFIDDISLLVEKIIKYNLVGNHIFEAIGPNTLSYRELYYLISKFMDKKRVLIPLPMKIAKVLVGVAEILHFSPINIEQLSLFERDNVKKNVDKDFKYFEITPQNSIQIIKKTANN